MWRLAAVLGAAALVVSAAGAAPVPVESRAAALLELQAAIEDELRALELVRRDPPRRDTARLRLKTSLDRLAGVRDFLSATPGAQAGEALVDQAWTADVQARDAVGRYEEENAIELIEKGLARKRAALPAVRAAKPPAAAAQCSDGKDNDGDGIVDWTLEPGCTSARDVRESTRFSCAVESAVASGRLALTGACSGAFSEVEFTLLDGLQLDGRFDIKLAPSCSPPTPTRVRCKTKNGAQNPGRLVDARFATNARMPGQRVQLRFFDIRKRQIARFFVPVLR
jgi:hypothetical protein